MKHRYTVNLSNDKFTLQVSPSTRYGYFERVADGTAGGLWFDQSKTLTDYDGVAVLPLTVCRILKNAGYIVPDEFWPNDKPE